jgi:hypothetical protein
LAEIRLGVFDRAFEDEKPVPERLELFAAHYEIVFTQTQLEVALAGLVIALAARPLAEELRSAGSPGRGESPSAPSTGP